MKTILLVFGTRPEAIKCIPLYDYINRQEDHIQIKTCLTFQHGDLLHQAKEIFNFQEDYALQVRKDRQYQDLGTLTSEIITKIGPVFAQAKPDLLLVQGDTTSTFAASLAAFYHKIPVAHLEAGLRTYNIYAPWPEEMNRQLVTRLAKYHFAPNEHNKHHLMGEKVNPDHIFVTGNTGLDALRIIVKKIEDDEDLCTCTQKDIQDAGYVVNNRKIVLVTLHRRENFGVDMRNIFLGIKQVAMLHPEVDFVFPVHLNPNVKEPAQELLSNIENIHLIAPLHYIAFICLMRSSTFVISDSGGVQEEVTAVGKPLLLMREVTERPEVVTEGSALLCGTDSRKLVDYSHQLLTNPAFYKSCAKRTTVFGDGHASEKIYSVLKTVEELC